MEVDRLEVIEINAMTKEERERHIQNELCFICHKSGHRSKERPDRKYKGGSKSGKTKGSTRRKARDSETDVIFKPPIWMTYLKKKKSRSLINLKKND